MFELYEKKETKSSANNKNLHNAKNAKNDEFYTQLTDIEKELIHYKEHFKDKIVYCNCDDPEWSNFWKYFHLNFAHLGLKKLIATFYHIGASVYKMEYTGGDDNDIEVGVKTSLEGNGDFRNEECIELLKEADIVVTNPPFSLFREYVAVLMEHKKKFIIWGNNNAITYKEFFPLLKDGKVWLGYIANQTCVFRLSDEYIKWDEKITKQMNDGHKYGKCPAISVFTNLDIQKRHEKLPLWKNYTPEEYPIYDNYAAWNVDRVTDIPVDKVFELTVDEETYKRLKDTYKDDLVLIDTDNGYHIKVNNPIIGVPITFLDKFNSDQFEIVGISGSLANPIVIDGSRKSGRFYIDGKRMYDRIVIRKKAKTIF